MMGQGIIQRSKILFLALFLCLCGALHANEAGSWKEIHTKSGDCSISFPQIPQMIQQNLKLNEKGAKLIYDIYLAPYQNKAVCLLLVAQYPAALPPGQELLGLEGLLRGIMGQHPENELMFAEVMDMYGFPSMTFLVQSGENYFRGQAVMVGSKLFLIAMEGKKAQFEEATFQRFLKSFKLFIP